jgi:hypothetical protein
MTEYFDRRQLILERVYQNLGALTIPLLGGANGPVTIVPGNIVHNRNELPAEKVPGIILLDADEVRDTRQMQPPPGMAQRAVPPAIYKMTPEIYVVLDGRPVSNDQNFGVDLNTARLAILGATLPDPYLQQLVSANGNIVYDGCVTDLARNRVMKGQLGISISFSYPLLLKEFVGI